MSSLRKSLISAMMTCGLAACGGARSEPATPAGEAPAERPSLTAQECEAGGGTVVGDIGDGAIHKPEYKCASGAAPTGSIRAAESGPMAVEGAVCCPK